MPQKVLHGFAWFAYPDLFGVEDESAVDPGHPFSERPGQVAAPPEVIYFRPASPKDAGVANEQRAHSYLVLTKTQLHPKLCRGWDSEPAVLTDKFKTEDNKVKLVRIVQQHHRHSGKLLECELKIEEN
jgi:hypothetical protein